MKYLSCIIITLLLFSISVNGFTQEKQKSRKEIRNEKKVQIASRVDSMLMAKDYVFNARSAHPMSMPVVNLTSEYDLKVKGDSVFVYLPYYGRAYQADYMSSEGGIKLEELYEDYRVEKDDDGYRIHFDAEGRSDEYIFTLSVSPSGYASLVVSCNNRQSIRFSGIIKGLGL
ncbi:MAG: DUF4251 domain-containing protein [Prolixibacteraceae bacterium]|jgi:hypothetical protein|nr:DUF4251 domain-containing protein [Prolixibacteraceae bacterium]